jgi:hypothetical protein
VTTTVSGSHASLRPPKSALMHLASETAKSERSTEQHG